MRDDADLQLLPDVSATSSADLHADAPPEGARGNTPPVAVPIPPPTTHNAFGAASEAVYLDPPRPQELTPRQRREKARQARIGKHAQFMEALDRKLNSQVRKVAQAMFRAPEVAASGPPKDMSPAEVRIARDAMMSQRECPVYLLQAVKILDSYKKAEVLSERDPAPRLNVETIQVAVTQQFHYPLLEAPETKR